MQNGIPVAVARQPMLRYKEHEVTSASPGKLVLYLYDHVIRSCGTKDCHGASRALAELIDALDFDYPDISRGLFRLYDYCLRLVKKGDFEVPRKIISELRESWEMALSPKQEGNAVGAMS